MAAIPHHTLFFTGKDDPRENIIVIGTTTVPLFFRIETPVALAGSTRTTVYRNADEVIATLDWIAGTHLGTASIAGRSIEMARLVAPGTSDTSHRFTGSDGNVYEWRKRNGDYELIAMANEARVADFLKAKVDTPVGEAHAVLHLTFDHELLILELIVALCLARWVDTHDM